MDWRIPGLAKAIPGHRVELLASAALFPLSALLTLYVRLRAFGKVSAPTSFIVIVASLCVASFWWVAQRKVERIREQLIVKAH